MLFIFPKMIRSFHVQVVFLIRYSFSVNSLFFLFFLERENVEFSISNRNDLNTKNLCKIFWIHWRIFNLINARIKKVFISNTKLKNTKTKDEATKMLEKIIIFSYVKIQVLFIAFEFSWNFFNSWTYTEESTRTN